MNTLNRLLLLISLLLTLPSSYHGQGSSDYQGGLKVGLNEDGSKYFRLLSWHQMWAVAQKGEDHNYQTNFLLRRSRVLMFAQINDRFLIYTHFGLNSLGADNMGATGPLSSAGKNGQLFMHGAWAQYRVLKGNKLHLGGGLHYWNGISRLGSQSTLNMLTLDAPIHNWPTIGTTDQFARHLGFYAKGKLGKLDYRLAINEAISNPSRGTDTPLDDTYGENGAIPNLAVYRNPVQPGGGKVFQGYVNYQFLDQESNTLAAFVGTYLGSKKVLNIGAGFFHHREGASYYDEAGNLVLHHPTSLGLDIFYDTPVGKKGAALTAYASLVKHDWGPNWTGGVGGVGTGTITYAQAGFVLPTFTKSGRLQPYMHFTNRNLEAYRDFAAPSANTVGAGANWYIDGHNAKLSLEYLWHKDADQAGANMVKEKIRMQAMVYL